MVGAQTRPVLCLPSLAALSGAPVGSLGLPTFPEFGCRAWFKRDCPRDAPGTAGRREGAPSASERHTGGSLTGARGRLTPPSCEGIAAIGGSPGALAGRFSRFSRFSRLSRLSHTTGWGAAAWGGSVRAVGGLRWGARGGGGRGVDWPTAAGRGGRDWPARRGERRAARGDWLRTRKQEGGRRRSRLAGSSRRRRRRRPRSLLRSLLRPLLRPLPAPPPPAPASARPLRDAPRPGAGGGGGASSPSRSRGGGGADAAAARSSGLAALPPLDFSPPGPAAASR